jgi:hypothetical protein
MRHTEADRALAARHVEEGEARIARQRQVIEERREKGWPTAAAKDVLVTMERTLDHMRDHLAQIEAALAQGR